MNKKFVSFTQAMEALKQGKVVRFYDEDLFYNSVFDYEYPINENGMEIHSFKDLLEGNWLIIE